MKNNFQNIIAHDPELAEGVEMILKNEGLSLEGLELIFEKSEQAFEDKLNYQMQRQAIIYDIFSYSNAAVVVAFMVAFIVLPIFGYSASDSFQNVGPYELAMGLKVTP